MIKIKHFMEIVLAFGILLSNVSMSVVAQETTPSTEEKTAESSVGMWLNPDTGEWMTDNKAFQLSENNLTSLGGPDDFGYTWDDSVTLAWIDATDGTVSSMGGYSGGQHTEAIPLPFTFKYYGQNYSNVYIAGSGYLTFSDEGTWPSQPRVPSPFSPNTIIAPYATPLILAYSGTENRIYHKSGGSAPNRYFVVEWYKVMEDDEIFTFEVILHENGNIVFQYQNMLYNGNSYVCGSIGIEDTSGIDGLAYRDLCNQAPSNKAVRFLIPPTSARVAIMPLSQGAFTTAGDLKDFQITVRNNGELGSDTYDLIPASIWPVSLFFSESGFPLTDTDADGLIDTGSIPMGSSVTLRISVQTPSGVNIGDSNSVSITITSSKNPVKFKLATIKSAIPAPFAQIFSDHAGGAVSLELIQPTSTLVKKITPDYYWPESLSVAEKGGGFINIWNSYKYLESNSRFETEYALSDLSGNIVRPITLLKDNSSTEFFVQEDAPALDVAPNGRIGLTWQNYTYSYSTNKYKYDIYFAVLDSSGNTVVSPTNITNNPFGTGSDLNFPRDFSPTIAATGDNRFVIAWYRSTRETNGSVDDIYFTTIGSDGTIVKPNTRFTSDTAGWDKSYVNPSLTTLTGNRVIMAWLQKENYTYQAVFTVLNSNGTEAIVKTGLGFYLNNMDMVQLSSGQILVAGQDISTPTKIYYTLLDGSSYSPIMGFTELSSPAAITGNAYVSVAADEDGHGILTWMDQYYDFRHNLYYALIDSSGAVLTLPMIFRTSMASDGIIQTSDKGYGNTSYSLVSPTTPNVDLKLTVPPNTFATSGGIGKVTATIQNIGKGLSTPTIVTATINPSLTYLSAEPAPISVVGNVITWSVPTKGFLGYGEYRLSLTMPVASTGTTYPIQWNVTYPGDPNLANNAATGQIMIGLELFLPLIIR